MKAAPPDPSILPYCRTDFQHKVLTAYIELGTAAKAAKACGTEQGTVTKIKKKIEKVAAAKGVLPQYDLSSKVGAGFELGNGYSLLTKTELGEPIWLKATKEKQQAQKALMDFADGLAEDLGTFKPGPKPKMKKVESDLLSAIFIGDAHYGMNAYGRETKHSDYDTQLAYDNMCRAIDDLVARSPNSEIGLLVDVGDYTHSNSSHNETFSGTPLDVDTRHGRVLDVASMGMNYAIQKMLTKFPKVVVVIVQGNHNPDVALAMARITSAYFRNETRVKVLETNGFFHYIEWGDWLMGFNHGDKIKPEKLVSVMARDMADAWGRCASRMWALGHFHHQDVKELDGCTVQKFAALPPPDSWHASKGFSSVQAMQMIVFRKEGGKHSTLIYELPRPVHKPDLRID